MFDSNNFADEDLNFLNFDSEFSIDVEDKIKIILGPNGTGKTSIYRNLKNRFPNHSFIDYENVEQSFLSENSSNEIVIAPSIALIAEKKSQIDSLKRNIDIKGTVKSMGITNKDTSKRVSEDFDDIRKNEDQAIDTFSNENLTPLFELNDNYKNFIVLNGKSIIEINAITDSIESIKDSYIEHIFKELNDYLSDDENVCPICGTDKNQPIKSIIAAKMAELNKIEQEVVKSYQNSHLDLQPKEVLNNLNEIKSIFNDNNITIENLKNYVLCGGDKNKADLIISSRDELTNLKNEIDELENLKERFYQNLKEHGKILNSTFKLQFDVTEDIVFDDDNKTIKIILPRKTAQYSTGEKNLMTFIVCILEFISSDSEILVVDDPLSSYDIPNQYKIIYEIVAAKKYNKKILVFTHNIDTLNIANSQYSSDFDYESFDKRRNTLFINKINYTTSGNILDPAVFLEKIDQNYTHLNYVKKLLAKDDWEPNEENHLIFHYDESYTTPDGEYTNEYLCNLIDSFDSNTLVNEGFLFNSANKIIYTAALRVWIEKKLYENLLDEDRAGLKNKEFGPKVIYAFSDNRWKGSDHITRPYLMSKKVMLNQHCHSKSQIMPFYYSLNLSLDDVSKEIMEIKKRFQ